MRFTPSRLAGLLGSLWLAAPLLAASQPGPAEILKQSAASDWQVLNPQDTLVMEVNGAQVILALAPRFAPRHAANIRTLAQGGYYDGLAIIRVQDNYVTQWGDPNDDDKDKAKPLGKAASRPPAEFTTAYRGLPIVPLADADGWAAQTGFVDGMPVAADPAANLAWIPHCYGVIGAARGNEVDSSNGTGLYVIIGQSPRALDRNITVVGRVVKGMEALSALPRGTGTLGFYEKPEQYVPIRRVRLLADLPEAERPALEVLRTDTETWKRWVEARRHASNNWFVHSPEHINVCNITIPTRPAARTGS